MDGILNACELEGDVDLLVARDLPDFSDSCKRDELRVRDVFVERICYGSAQKRSDEYLLKVL